MVATIGAAVAVACGAGSPAGGGDGSGAGNATGGNGAGNVGGGNGGDLFGTGGGMVTGLVLEPQKATILVDEGMSMPVTFTAKRNGQIVYPSLWSVDRADVAGADAKGVVTATNQKGGKVKLTAELEGAIANAEVTVIFKKTVNPAGVLQNTQDLLKNAKDPDGGVVWAYPYDGTVWPRGLLGPEMMWNGGGPGDIYYLHFTSAYLDLSVFTNADPPSRYPIAADDWIAINESGAGEKVDVHVARLVPATMASTVVIDHQWTMAHGSLRGTVYYWANNLGRIVRIKPGASQPDDFLATAGVGGCSTCHTVSADGHTLIIGGDTSASNFNLLTNTVTLGLGSVGKAVRNWAMPAISPDGKFLVENNGPLPGPPGGSDAMFDAATGMKINGTGLDGVLLDMPAFGPAGTKLAYVGHGGTHDLRIYDFDLGTGQVSNDKLLVVAGGDPNLNAIAFPSVSPTQTNKENAKQTWIVYHRGVYPSSLDTRFGPGHLYFASADDPNVEVRLSAANGDSYPFAAGDRDRGNNYEPTFAPAAAGGYMWVVFTSRRTYGNRLTGGPGEVKQLWVTAIDLFPEPGKDPSHPAFWVPGQDINTWNMRGFWALDPCIQKGDMCTESGECCDGEPCENGVCGGPDACAEIGEYCDDSADCCDPNAACIGNECTYKDPT